MLRIASSFVGVILVLLLVPSAHAQIEITEADSRALVGEQIAVLQMSADSPSEFESFFDQSGDNLTFDFTPYEYSVVFSGYQQGWEASNAPSDIPFLSRFMNRGANVVVETRFEAQQTAETDSTYWLFEQVTSSERSLVGFSSLYSQDLDQDGEQPDSAWAEWSPARILSPLPLDTEDEWSQNADLSFSFSVLPSTSSGRDSEVDAYGTLKTPVGSASALRVREVITDTITVGPIQQVSQSTTLNFFTKGLRLAATITRNDDTGQITDAFFTVRADEGQAFQVAQGETPTLSGPGVEIGFSQASAAAGTLRVSRFDTAPLNDSFSGSASSDDGTSVTPDVLWEGRYFVVQNQGLDDFSADVCIDISSTPGVSDAGKLLVLTRDATDEAWSPLNSTLDGNQLCATVSSFSQFAVGANSSSNALPVDLAGFTGQAEGKRARLTWKTVSETDNVGFEVLHRSGPDHSWQDLGFVESKAAGGTAPTPTTYRFTTDPLPAGTHHFRLRQTDVDGTATSTDPVSVEIQLQEAVRLTAPTPNPVAEGATFRFGTKEATNAEVAVYDVLGRRMVTLHQGRIQPGQMKEVELEAESLPAGTYFVRLRAGDEVKTRRVTVVR